MKQENSSSIAFVINPRSGKKWGGLKFDLFMKKLKQEKHAGHLYFTEYRGHAKELTKQLLARGYTIIVAVGGDGTVNEVASELVSTDAALGIVPFGSGNGLARHLNIPMQWSKALRLIETGEEHLIDAGKINHQWFFCTCGVGFDASIGHKFTRVNNRGFTAYLRIVLSEFGKYKSRRYRFSVDGKKFKRKAFVITVANASQYGNNAFIAPGARIDDGIFDVCIIKPFPPVFGFELGLKMFNRSITDSKFYEAYRGRTIKFRKKKKKYNFHYDGEAITFKKEKVVITMHHQVLRVKVPGSANK